MDRVWIERVMAHLRQQYVTQAPLPLRGTAVAWPGVAERPGTLRVQQLRKLFRCVETEGYGE